MIFLPYAFLFSFLVCLVCCQTSDQDVYFIQHAIANNQFAEIGTFNLRSIRHNQNQAQFDQQQTISSIPVESDLIDEKTRQQIASATNGSLYRLRLCRKGTGMEMECSVASFIYLDKVVNAQFKINLNVNTGMNHRLSSVSIKAREQQRFSKEEEVEQQAMTMDTVDRVTFYTSVHGLRQGQTPESEAYLEKVKKEIEQKERTAQGGNESFLQKYWIYIVPAIVIMFLMNFVGQDGPG